MESLKTLNALKITQKKEWGEILTGFETRNRYSVMNSQGQEVYVAAEEGGSFLIRNFLKSWRPFKVHIMRPNGERVLRLEAPFRFFFRQIGIYDSSGKRLGLVERRWSWVRRLYTVQDGIGHEIFQLLGPVFHPWTFKIQVKEREVGKIVKRWSGLLKEAYTDADNFDVSFPQEAALDQKAILLGAVFLIDFVHFESNKR